MRLLRMFVYLLANLMALMQSASSQDTPNSDFQDIFLPELGLYVERGGIVYSFSDYVTQSITYLPPLEPSLPNPATTVPHQNSLTLCPY